MLVQDLMHELAKHCPTAKVVCLHKGEYVTLSRVMRLEGPDPVDAPDLSEVTDDVGQPMFKDTVVLDGGWYDG